MERPIYPVVRGRLAQILKNRHGTSSREAIDEATALITEMRRWGMDVVMGDWINGKEERLSWDHLEELAAELEERRPWNPVELRSSSSSPSTTG